MSKRPKTTTDAPAAPIAGAVCISGSDVVNRHTGLPQGEQVPIAPPPEADTPAADAPKEE